MRHIFYILQAVTAATITFSACSHNDKEFTFVQLTDPQLRFTRETGIEGTTDFQLDSIHLQKAVIQINELKPAFVIVTGDLVHDITNDHDVNVYQDLMGKIDPSIPVYQIPGNHDIKDGNNENQIKTFVSRFGSDRFTFEQNGIKFIGLNSSIIRYTNETLEAEQFKWLSTELKDAKTKGEPAYVFAHCPVFVDSIEEEESYHSFQPCMRRKYWDLFKANGVKAMIAGHLHYNKMNSLDGIANIITGPSGYSFEGEGREGFRLWTVSKDGFKSSFIYLPGHQVSIAQGFTADKLQAPWHGRNDSTLFSCHSDQDRFFFSFEVKDSTFSAPEASTDERIVEGEDRVEIFFSPTMSLRKSYYCAEIDAAGRIMDYKADYYRKFDFKWSFKTMEVQAVIFPWGYKVDGSVSKKELSNLDIDLDNGFWMGSYRGDRTADGTIEWYSLVPVDVTEPDFHAPGVMFSAID